MIVQANKGTHKQNSECFGAKVGIMSRLMDRIDWFHALEKVLADSIVRGEFQTVQLPRNDIPEIEQVKRSRGTQLAYL